MADVWVIVTVIGFFGLCVAFVWGCDAIIGPDEVSELEVCSEPDELVGGVVR